MYAPVLVQIDGCRNNKWGFLATDVKDAPTCVMGCRDKFWMSLVPNDETFSALCRMLSATTNLERAGILHALYCCDAQLCGVDNIIGSQRDPNVNWVVSNCQSLGFSSILDPGPPGMNAVCTSANNRQNYCSAIYAPSSRSTASLPQSTSTTLLPGASSTPSFTMTITSVTAQPTLSISRIQDPSLNASIVGNADAQDSNSLSSESKVTIVLIVSVICIAIFIALVFILYRRNKSKSRGTRPDQQLLENTSPSPPGPTSPVDPQSPLCSPALSLLSETRDGVPLTPPPRLQQRRYLASQSSRGSPTERISRRNGFHIPMTLRSTNKSPDEPTRSSLDAIVSAPVDYTHMDSLPPAWSLNNHSNNSNDNTNSNNNNSPRAPIRPEEIGVAREFPPPHTATSPLPQEASDDSPPSRRVLSTIIDERDLEMLGGTYRQAR